MVFAVQFGFAAVDGDDERVEFIRRCDVTNQRADIPETELPQRGKRSVVGLGGVVHQFSGGGGGDYMGVIFRLKKTTLAR